MNKYYQKEWAFIWFILLDERIWRKQTDIPFVL